MRPYARTHIWILAALLAIAAGCDRQNVDGHPVPYWIDQTYSSRRIEQVRAIKALQQFPRDAAAAERLAEIRSDVAEQRERNWQAICADLLDTRRTRAYVADILLHLENCPDRPGPDTPYSPIGFPGRRQELQDLLKQRRDATIGDDRELYQQLLDAAERR